MYIHIHTYTNIKRIKIKRSLLINHEVDISKIKGTVTVRVPETRRRTNWNQIFVFLIVGTLTVVVLSKMPLVYVMLSLFGA